MDRAFVALQLILRVNDYGVINQRRRSICGPAAFVTAIAKEDPGEYARYVTGMAENGRANLKTMAINPWRNILSENPAHDNIPRRASELARAIHNANTAILARASGEKELEGMEAAIQTSEKAVHALQAELNDPAFYKMAGPKAQEKVDALKVAEEKVAKLYARWEALLAMEQGQGV